MSEQGRGHLCPKATISSWANTAPFPPVASANASAPPARLWALVHPHLRRNLQRPRPRPRIRTHRSSEHAVICQASTVIIIAQIGRIPLRLLKQAHYQEDLTTLEAPVDGTVQQLAIHTVGGVVTPAQPLMVIVPQD